MQIARKGNVEARNLGKRGLMVHKYRKARLRLLFFIAYELIEVVRPLKRTWQVVYRDRAKETCLVPRLNAITQSRSHAVVFKNACRVYESNAKYAGLQDRYRCSFNDKKKGKEK